MEKMPGSPSNVVDQVLPSVERGVDLATDSGIDTKDEKNSRRVFHIFAAVIAAGFLLAFLSFFSFYSKFFRDRQRTGIQMAARADLMLVYNAEQAFHEAHGFYTTDLVALDIRPKKVLYKFGFVKPSVAHPELKDLDPNRMDLDQVRAARPHVSIEYSSLTGLAGIDFAKLGEVCADCTASDQSFKLLAAANLDTDEDLDLWVIDQGGKIEHLNDDLQLTPSK